MLKTQGKNNIFLSLFKRYYLFIHERHRERGRDTGRGRTRLPAGNLMQDWIPGPRGHTQSRRQMLNHWATQVPVHISLLSNSLGLGFQDRKKKSVCVCVWQLGWGSREGGSGGVLLQGFIWNPRPIRTLPSSICGFSNCRQQEGEERGEMHIQKFQGLSLREHISLPSHYFNYNRVYSHVQVQ